MKKSTRALTASLVIPVFNNEKTAVSLLKQCRQIMEKICQQYEIIVSDDKSTDQTAQLLKKNFSRDGSFHLIFNKSNQGIARNIRSLYKSAKYDYIALFSVDGDWKPRDIERMLQYAHNNKADIVIGKRTYRHYSPYRKIVSFFYNFLSFLFFQIDTIDAGSIKVFKKAVFDKTLLISKSVFFEAEFIIRAVKKGYRAESIPIDFITREKRKGAGGNMSLVLSSFKDLVSLRLRL